MLPSLSALQLAPVRRAMPPRGLPLGTTLDPEMLQRLDSIRKQLYPPLNPQLDATSATARADRAIERMRHGFYNADNEQYTDNNMYEEDVQIFDEHYPNADPLWKPMLLALFKAMIAATSELADYVDEFYPQYMPPPQPGT